MTAIEDARRVLLDADAADDMSWPVTVTGMHALMEALRALIAEHERLIETCGHPAWEENGSSRRCADCKEHLATPPTDNEREAQGWREAEAYADDNEPSRRAETADDFMQGWRTADRTRRQGPITDAQVEFARQVLRDHRFFSEDECQCGAPWSASHPMRAALEAARRVK